MPDAAGQVASGDWHATSHAPLLQARPAAQGWLHAPQLFVSVFTSVQNGVPIAGTHSTRPVPHCVAHWLITHASAMPQECPQAPQSRGFWVKSVQYCVPASLVHTA